MAKQKKADTAGPVEVKKKKKDKRQRGEWTGEQELALVKLLIENPSYQETLFHLWFPRNLRHLRKDLASKDVVEDSDQSDSSTPPMDVESTLRASVLHVFGSNSQRCPSQVDAQLRRLRFRYTVQRGMMGPEAKRMLLREMTLDADDSNMAQMSEERQRLLERCPWLDAFHELVLNRIRPPNDSSTEAPTSQPSETLSTGQHLIKEEEREQEEWPSIRIPSVDEGQSDEEDELEDEFEEEPSDSPSQPAESALSYRTQHQQNTQATASTSDNNEIQADTKPPKHIHASKKIRSSRQSTSSTATAGRYRHERNMMRTQLLIEREAIKRLELEREATKRLELELKEKESKQSLSFFSQRMDALESSIMKRLGSLEERMSGR
ncbi:hypothetical protein A4X13_0g8993 [Tilletia indica]|uniref:Uncharacterized protein n=1 Tax=Tilletia indica TaxID=43049 RepID=A0A177TNU2_9BASI|nr:hypothetical protein A4X13_0g8993 [Tilletia indica]